jgi:hypothetical protein
MKTLMFRALPLMLKNWNGSLPEIEVNSLSLKAILSKYTVFIAQADWTLILPSATSCEKDAPLAEKNVAARPEKLAHIVYFFR